MSGVFPESFILLLQYFERRSQLKLTHLIGRIWKRNMLCDIIHHIILCMWCHIKLNKVLVIYHLHMLYMSSSDTGVLPVLDIVTWVSRPMLSPVFLWQLVPLCVNFKAFTKGQLDPILTHFLASTWSEELMVLLQTGVGLYPSIFCCHFAKELWKTVSWKSVTGFVCEFLEHTCVVFSLLSEPWAEGSSNSNGNSS